MGCVNQKGRVDVRKLNEKLNEHGRYARNNQKTAYYANTRKPGLTDEKIAAYLGENQGMLCDEMNKETKKDNKSLNGGEKKST